LNFGLLFAASLRKALTSFFSVLSAFGLGFPIAFTPAVNDFVESSAPWAAGGSFLWLRELH
jgi:hypothetical protein